MLDRTEAPQVQDGYGISVAYACIIEIVRSIALIVGGTEYLRDQDYEPPGKSKNQFVMLLYLNNKKIIFVVTPPNSFPLCTVLYIIGNYVCISLPGWVTP